MKSHSLLLGALAGLALAGCATNGTSRSDEQANLATEPGDAEISRHRIRSWSALNDHTLIFEASDGTRYKAETLGPCFGLDFANGIGFANRGGFQQIDRFTSVVLPDGTRCSFQSFNKVVAPETKALDSFEKLSADEEKSEKR